MTTNLDKYRADLKTLIDLGERMLADLYARHLEQEGRLGEAERVAAKQPQGTFEREYQRWYTEATAVVRQLIPDRLTEFEHLYKGDGKRKDINQSTYSIQDWLNGLRAGADFYEKKHFDDFAAVTMRFSTQLEILKAAGKRFESRLFDIRQLIQADLFDSELEAARELMKKGFLRAAGAMAGVVLERHLAQVASNHGTTVKKKDPSIGDLNDLLKSNDVFDVPTWRQVQRLGDLRNLCDHNKTREPTKDEVEELIAGVEKATKTLF